MRNCWPPPQLCCTTNKMGGDELLRLLIIRLTGSHHECFPWAINSATWGFQTPASRPTETQLTWLASRPRLAKPWLRRYISLALRDASAGLLVLTRLLVHKRRHRQHGKPVPAERAPAVKHKGPLLTQQNGSAVQPSCFWDRFPNRQRLPKKGWDTR